MGEAALVFVVNAVWQSTLVGALGLFLARFVQSPRERFALLALTLVAAVAAPSLTLVPRDATPIENTITLPPAAAPPTLGTLYLAGLAFVASRVLIAVFRARRIAANSIPFRGRMRLSESIDAPVTIGGTIFLPPGIAGERTLLAAAIAHERAHVRRNDYVVHVALEVIALPLYFHPVALLLRRALAGAREMACDEEAARRCGRRAYAEALVRLASHAVRHRALAMGMAATPIERRVAALLHPMNHASRSRFWSALLFIPLAAAAACSRVNVAPAAQSLCGHWALIAEASDLGNATSVKYDAFTQVIEQGPTRVAVRQARTAGGRTQHLRWSVITDGVTRRLPEFRSAGAAAWEDGKLELRMIGPGSHRETAVAFIRDGRLVVDGQTERGAYHSEFRRIDP